MRIATTASPVSGADVRERSHKLKLSTKVKRSLEVLSFAWHSYTMKQQQELLSRAGYGRSSTNMRKVADSSKQS